MPGAGALLAIAIVAEVVATTALKASGGSIRSGYAWLAAIGYLIAFSALSHALRTIPLGIAYAIWSGVGLVVITLAGLVLFAQKLDAPALVGIGLILAGVLCINLLSSTTVAE